MKWNKKGILLACSALMLASCAKSISFEEAKAIGDTIYETAMAEDWVVPEEVAIQNNPSALADNRWEYKEGEYYYHRSFALLIFVPLESREWLFKQDGSFYHVVDAISNNNDRYSEITEEEFNTLMAEKQKTIREELRSPIKNMKSALDHDSDGKNSYKSGGEGSLIIKTDWTESSVEGQSTEYNYSMEFKNFLPLSMKGDSTTKNEGSDPSKSSIKYSYRYSGVEEKHPTKDEIIHSSSSSAA